MLADMRRMEAAARLSMGHVGAPLVDRRGKTAGPGSTFRFVALALMLTFLVGGTYLLF